MPFQAMVVTKGSTMATDPKEAQAKLKQLQSKLPKSAPQQFQKDYTSFLRSADKLMSDIDDAAKVSTKKDREEYERKKRDADAAKKKVNDAVAKQQGQSQKVQGDV